VSARIVHQMPFDAVRDAIHAAGVPDGHAEAFWLGVRNNLAGRQEIAEWGAIVCGAIAGRIDDPAFAEAAAAVLPDEPFDQETWGRWTEAVKQATGAKGRALFMPLRLALTGREAGPELQALLPLMGRAKVLARLHGHCA
jgi:glutamyl-tRNA synthetase